jgi:chromosome segregation ATPase
MNRLHYVNFVGVLILAGLCVFQWTRDRRLNLELNRLEQTRLEQAARLGEQERTVRDLSADLEEIKKRFAQSQTEIGDIRQNLRAAENQARQLTVERDQLKTSVTNWAAAVATRDERLKEANTRIRKLSDDLNASINKFNELATNYNVAVKDLNELRARPRQ